MGELESLAASGPRFAFTPRFRNKSNFVGSLRAMAAWSRVLTGPSRKEELAEAMASGSTCVFRDSRSEAIDASVHPRWTFKVLGRSVSPPPICGYQPFPSFKPSAAMAHFEPNGGWSSASCQSRPGMDRSVASEQLAEAMRASKIVVFGSGCLASTDISLAAPFVQVATIVHTYSIAEKAHAERISVFWKTLSEPEKPPPLSPMHAHNAVDWDEKFEDDDA